MGRGWFGSGAVWVGGGLGWARMEGLMKRDGQIGPVIPFPSRGSHLALDRVKSSGVRQSKILWWLLNRAKQQRGQSGSQRIKIQKQK